jgi:Cu+-exporting ATPase
MKINIFLVMILMLAMACQSGNNSDKKPADAEVAMTEVTLTVGGMHCEMCVASIEKGVGQIAGVDSVSAVLDDSTAFIRFNPQIASLNEISLAIEKRGYTVKKSEE